MNRRNLTKYLLSLPIIGSLPLFAKNGRVIKIAPGEYSTIPDHWNVIRRKSQLYPVCIPVQNGILNQIEYKAPFVKVKHAESSILVSMIDYKTKKNFDWSLLNMDKIDATYRMIIIDQNGYIGMACSDWKME